MPRNHRNRRDNAVQKVPCAAGGGRNEVRIIGGRWRGRKIRFPAGATIRPSPDRVRETLFNWLAPVMRGARCLDLFAGSGALGFEALSRGAAGAVLVERDPAVVRHLQALAAELAADGAKVVQADAQKWPGTAAGPFDVVFLDPPFGSGMLPGLLDRLGQPGWLAPGGRVYIECAAADGPPALPTGWRLLRSGRAGDVGYHLAAVPGAEVPAAAGVPDGGPQGGRPA